MSQALFFAHANGFPCGSYAKLLEPLRSDYAIHHLPQHGHDPRFPVDDNWGNLVGEMVHHLEALGTPVWGVGHSFGGLLHLQTALCRPDLYQGVIMLDSPFFTLPDQWVIRAAKRLGLIDRLTPAGRTQGRREVFDDPTSARRYFAGKALFRRFDPDCLDAYLQHGLQAEGSSMRLSFNPRTEIDIYRSVPDTRPGSTRGFQLPLALVRGERSDTVRRHHTWAARALARGEFHQVPGSHMFPLEHPLQTAALIRQVLARWQGDTLKASA